jgi:DNA-binding NarL/FixJ family response regulator
VTVPTPLFVIDDGSSPIRNVLDALGPTADIEVVGRVAALAELSRSEPDRAPEYLIVNIGSLLNATDEELERLARTFPRSHMFVVADFAIERRDGDGTTADRDGHPDDAPFAAMAEAGATGVLIHREFVPALVPRMNYLRRLRRATPPPDSPFTPREQQVLTLLGRGLYVDKIARTLGLSVHTIRGHVKSILGKLDSHTQLEAVAKAKAKGWLPDF